jgi:mono/diheme cytochrome c family protein
MAGLVTFACDVRIGHAAQAEASPMRGLSRATQSKPASDAGPATAIQVFRISCLECHDDDGRGEIGRDLFPQIPDFTSSRWQASRTDAALSRSILDGNGKSMPRMRNKLGSVDVMQIVAFVRAFRGGKQVVSDEPDVPGAPAAREQPDGAAGETGPALPSPSTPNHLSIREGNRLFQRLCVKCHGADGRGAQMRETEPAIPDFTRPAWQKVRRDPQLAVSVLDGKGNGMPPFRGKLGPTHVRDLVAYIRALGPAVPRSVGNDDDDFEARFKQLEDELENHRRQFQNLSPVPRRASGTTMK